MKIRPALLLAAPLVALLVLPVTARALTIVKMKPASTRVGIARVVLELADLQVEGPRLGGTYRIKIPLAPNLNDRGDILLEADALEAIMVSGGTVVGTGHSRLDGRTHQISCEFERGGRVSITVETPDRVLSFETAYELLESPVALH